MGEASSLQDEHHPSNCSGYLDKHSKRPRTHRKRIRIAGLNPPKAQPCSSPIAATWAAARRENTRPKREGKWGGGCPGQELQSWLGLSWGRWFQQLRCRPSTADVTMFQHKTSLAPRVRKHVSTPRLRAHFSLRSPPAPSQRRS